MKLKDLSIPGKTFLAPLAGITNLPFRKLVKSCGCAVVCSEMVSAKGIFYNSEKTLTLMQSTQEERPLSVQIFGSDPPSMGKAAAFVEAYGTADILDINFGCSVKKVVKQGAGVALMKDPGLTRTILKTVRQATTLPFTIKLRSGWDASGDQALAFAVMAQEEGVDAVAVHPRTAAQGFRGISDWQVIRRVKQAVDIPVIGNGDITSPEDAARMMDETGCDAVMVGRAAMADPFILSQIDSYLASGTYRTPSPEDIFRKMAELARLYVGYFGEETACKMLRGRLTWFVRGLPGASAFRRQLACLGSLDQALGLIQGYERQISGQD